MKTKTFEIRDRMTFIGALATKLEPGCPRDSYLLSRSGYGLRPEDQSRYVVLSRLEGDTLHYDPFAWNSRTMTTAHRYIVEHFDELESGAVIDVEFILGETTEPKGSEFLSTGGVG